MAFEHTPAFDPKDVAKRLAKSRARDREGWQNHLDSMSEDQRYYVQKEFLQKYSPAEFDGWFGLSALLTQLTKDPLLASMHNPSVWLYALEQSSNSTFSTCSVLYAYWTSVAIMRPSEHFEPKLLAKIHAAVRQAVVFVEEDGQPWTTGLNPGVVSCPEEIALFDMPWPKALEAVTAYILQYRDLESLSKMPIAYPTLTVLLRIMQAGCFPQRYETNPMPWPTPEEGVAWTDDLRLSLHAVSAHPKLRHWWTLPSDVAALPQHLNEAALMLDIGVQLGYLATIKEWIVAQTHQ